MLLLCFREESPFLLHKKQSLGLRTGMDVVLEIENRNSLNMV